jgi:diguanylate cyclase (GGDEF)-like protein
LSLLMIDLDRFKSINDQHGHQAGDRALAAVGELLRIGVRDTDVVGRYGGDEFMVILPETPPAGALIAANRLLARAANLYLETEGGSVPVRLSVGIGTLIPDDHHEESWVDREHLTLAAQTLIGSADRALYAAKGSGRAGARSALHWEDVVGPTVEVAAD